MKLYEKCSLEHIPTRLHRHGRKVCNRFYLNEEIYRRCPTNLVDAPFATITLSDISINRQGKPIKRPFSLEDDVLYNTVDKSGDNVPKYNETVVILKIKRLLRDHSYRKVFILNGNILMMYLKHDPIPCNYAHTVFEFVLNNEIVTFQNYSNSLGRRALKRLREDCRLQIAKMIIRREIS
jgi:hypothetical protein